MMKIVRSAYSSIPFDLEPSAGLCKEPDTEEARLRCGYRDASHLLATSSEEEDALEYVYKVCLLSSERTPLMCTVSLQCPNYNEQRVEQL